MPREAGGLLSARLQATGIVSHQQVPSPSLILFSALLMSSSPQYLQLVFLASTVTPASGAGWVFTTTPAPQPRPVGLATPRAALRLQVVIS